MSSRRPPRDLVALAGITALAAALRFATLDVQSFWFDEAATVGVLDNSFGAMLEAIPRGESTPPLYYVIAWLWSRPFGLGEVGLRSLSALLGTVTVPVAFLAARELCAARGAQSDRRSGRGGAEGGARSEPVRVGLWVAALAAVSPFLVWYSQEARSYALLVLLGALAVWLFARLLLRTPHGRDAASWAVVAALALATHYFAVFLVAPMALWLLLRAPRRLALPAVGAVGLAGVALLPIALDQQRAELAGFIDDGSLALRAAQVVKQLALGFDSPVEPVTAAIAVAIVAVGAALALWRLRGHPGVRIAAVLGAAAIVLPVVLALAGTDYVLTRNVILAWLPLAVVVVAALTGAGARSDDDQGRRERRAGKVALGVLAGLGLASTIGVAFVGEWQREDWRGAAEAIGPPAARVILVTEPSQATPVALYRERAALPEVDPVVVEEVVALARRDDDADRAVPPSPDVIASLGLRVAERQVEPTYELLRLVPEAGPAVPLTAGQALALGLDVPERSSALLVEPAAGEPAPSSP